MRGRDCEIQLFELFIPYNSDVVIFYIILIGLLLQVSDLHRAIKVG